MTSSVPDNFVSNHYNFYRNDRNTGLKVGGVLIGVKTNFKSIDVSNDSSFEDKWVEIVIKIEKYSFEHFGGTHIKSLIMWHQCFFAGPKK